MIKITLWLLLTVADQPMDTKVLETHKSREACEEIQISEYIAGRTTRCVAFQVQVPKP